MVAGIYFLKELLLFIFTKILLGVRSQTRAVAADLLHGRGAVGVSRCADRAGGRDHRRRRLLSGVSSLRVGQALTKPSTTSGTTRHVHELHRSDLDAFRAFLRGLMMHAAVGTALGGVTTQVGEPQNLLIAKQADWEFVEFFVRMAPVSMPVLVVGLADLRAASRSCAGSVTARSCRPACGKCSTSTIASRPQSARRAMLRC